MKTIFIALLFMILGSLSAQTIYVYGDWNYTIPTSDITEAGEDFTGTYESSSYQVYFYIYYRWNWDISVQKNDIDWNDDIKLFVRRTSNGYGWRGNVRQGTSYMELEDYDNFFFEGRNYRYYVTAQYELRNISVTIPANTYMTEVIYTLTAD